MSSVKGFSQGIRQIVILGSVLLWIGCQGGVEVAPTTPPAATGGEAVAEASAIPNITSSIFQNQSFECLNEVYNTSQNVKQSVPFQKDFEKCRFLAVIAEEFLGGKSTNRGHVFSREALENPASDTFGEYRNEVIKPNTSANGDLSASQRAQSDLSGRCSATEEIKVKKIEPIPGALRIVPAGCKDGSDQLEYAFSLVFCCPKNVNVTSSSNPTRFREQKEKAFALLPGSITVNPNVTVSQSEKTGGFVVTFNASSAISRFDRQLFISARGSDPLTPGAGVQTITLTRGDENLYVEDRDGSLGYRLSTAGAFGIFASVFVKRIGGVVTVDFTIDNIERGSARIESFLFHMQDVDGSVSGAHFFSPFTGFRF